MTLLKFGTKQKNLPIIVFMKLEFLDPNLSQHKEKHSLLIFAVFTLNIYLLS